MTKKSKKDTQPAYKEGSIAYIIRHFILKNKEMGNKEILELVKEYLKGKGIESKTSESCVAWYKVKMRKEGVLEGGRTQVKIDTSDLK